MNYSDINNAGELDINEITKRVFSEVKPPKSIKLLFDNVTLKEVFEALLTFTVNGAKHKFSQDGVTVDIESLSEQDIAEISGYVNSIGFNLSSIRIQKKNLTIIFFLGLFSSITTHTIKMKQI